MGRYTLLWMAFFLVLVLSGGGRAFSQTVIEGLVTEAGSGAGVTAYVLARPPGQVNLAVGYVVTDEAGNYRLEFVATFDSVDLSVTGLGVKSLTRRVANRDGRQDFRVERETFKLREVEVQAPKVRLKGRDTIVYQVDAIKTEDDRVIEDVLKKLPGIRVRKDGRITYKGKPVDLTIEGMDLLKGRYGVATKNIAPEHISTVEILENHQAVKALEGLMPSDRTTLNLKLKESSKGVFIASLGAGGGYDGGGLWDGEGAGMYFGHRSQHIVTLKGNNTGKDLRYELSDHSGGGAASLSPTLSNPTLASPPGIDKEHYYFNCSESASLNNLFKNAKGLITNLNAVYLHDHEDRSTQEETEWMLPDSSRHVIREDIANSLETHRVEADLSFKKNESKLYLNNENRFSGEFNGMGTDVNGLEQSYRLRSFKASSRTSVIRRVGERTGYNLFVRADYEHKPYRLEVDSATGVMAENPYAGAVQEVVSDGLRASAHASLYRRLRFWGLTLSPAVQAEYRMDRLESLLEGPWIGAGEESLYGNLLYMHRLVLKPTAYLRHQSARWDVSLGIPLSYRMTVLDNRMGRDLQRHKVFVEPSLMAKYIASASVDLRFAYGMNWRMPEVSRLYEGYILTDYRSLGRYRADLTEGMTQTFAFSTDFKDIFGMFFLGFDAGYSLGNPRVLYGLDFDGIYSTTIARDTRRLSHFVYGSLEASKSFSWKDAVLKGVVSASYSESPYLMQEVVSTSYGQGYSAELEFSFSPFNFLGFSYAGNVLYTLYGQEDGEGLQPLLTNSNHVGLRFRLPKNVNIDVGGDHYYNGASAGKKNFVLFDAGIEYSYKKFRWSFSCRNLLGVQDYVYSTISPVSSFQTRYRIRPRMFFLKMYVTL